MHHSILMLVGCKKGKCCQHSIMSRSQDGYLLCKPTISRDCSNTFLERPFLYAAPHEWNSLQRGVRVSEFNAFKKVIKTVLFIQGYPSLNCLNVYCRLVVHIKLQVTLKNTLCKY